MLLTVLILMIVVVLVMFAMALVNCWVAGGWWSAPLMCKGMG